MASQSPDLGSVHIPLWQGTISWPSFSLGRMRRDQHLQHSQEHPLGARSGGTRLPCPASCGELPQHPAVRHCELGQAGVHRGCPAPSLFASVRLGTSWGSLCRQIPRLPAGGRRNKEKIPRSSTSSLSCSCLFANEEPVSAPDRQTQPMEAEGHPGPILAYHNAA